MKPRYITFTGFDKFTDIRKAVGLALLYPIEYGFLFSPTKIDNRYYKKFSDASIFMLQNRMSIKVAAHLCGDYARIINDGEQDILEILPELKHFDRWQINSLSYNLENCAKYAKDRDIILQCREDYFPLTSYPGLYWLYDKSGGNGKVPSHWPEQGEVNQFIGYAGGINSENVLDVVNTVGSKAYSYWIDMEFGVRTNNLFDLSKIEEICKKVYEIEKV